MKKLFAALLVSVVFNSYAASDALINATVEGVPGTNVNGGLVVLRSTDKNCRYYGDIWETPREPRGLRERVMALASNGKVYDWMTVISYSSCLRPDGRYVVEPISLVSPGGKRLRIGDSVALRSSM
ncbi:hypothetical protein LMG28614_03263 [Paraburkholderia ultramafica]|uniref:Uncharacterized protein n=1 Tax=Paraburkholderia ultramafica TaxID=1544867 RepID=A0A6S7B844_9BURK|nr:hypothetical protein [Paraburkholderia ultramafica]CAB3791250.1 hypothetical protein LMG28614_03263 [Paraburkholderia ultramafica]